MTLTTNDTYVSYDSSQQQEAHDFLRRTSLPDHQYFLKMTPLGRYVSSVNDETRIEYSYHDMKPCSALYLSEDNFNKRRFLRTFYKTRGDFHKAAQEAVSHCVRISYRATSATVIGHELRHAQWNIVNSADSLPPESAEERILWDRFTEADGRAIQFGIFAQLATCSINPPYAEALLHSQEPFVFDFFHNSKNTLEKIGETSDLLRQKMRHVFDYWISISPTQPTYENSTIRQLRSSQELSKMGGLGGAVHRLIAYRNTFTRKGVREEFVRSLVEKLGRYDDGNYLTQTEGPDFMEPCYQQICNVRMEKLAEHIKPNVPEGLPRPIARFFLPLFHR